MQGQVQCHIIKLSAGVHYVLHTERLFSFKNKGCSFLSCFALLFPRWREMNYGFLEEGKEKREDDHFSIFSLFLAVLLSRYFSLLRFAPGRNREKRRGFQMACQRRIPCYVNYSKSVLDASPLSPDIYQRI